MKQIFEAMGTIVSLRCPAGSTAAVEQIFSGLEARFSLYREDSEASRMARGELLLKDASTEMRSMYALAHDWRVATDGAFQPHRPDGVIDLAGVVKAEAIRRSGELLASTGEAWLVNAGGDVLTSGEGVVGIVAPTDRGRLLSQFTTTTTHRAVATSGTAERGEHIWRVGSRSEFTQVTVAAPDIITADVLATAIVAGGQRTLHKMVREHPIQVLAVGYDGSLVATSAFRRSAG